MFRRKMFALFASCAAIGPMGCAHHHGGPPSPEKMQRMAVSRAEWFLDAIDATDAQRAVIVPKAEALGRNVAAFRKSTHDVAPDFFAELKGQSPDREKLRKLIDERVESLRTMLQATADDLVEVHATLTPEQRQKITSRLERRFRDD